MKLWFGKHINIALVPIRSSEKQKFRGNPSNKYINTVHVGATEAIT